MPGSLLILRYICIAVLVIPLAKALVIFSNVCHTLSRLIFFSFLQLLGRAGLGRDGGWRLRPVRRGAIARGRPVVFSVVFHFFRDIHVCQNFLLSLKKTNLQ